MGVNLLRGAQLPPQCAGGALSGEMASNTACLVCLPPHTLHCATLAAAAPITTAATHTCSALHHSFPALRLFYSQDVFADADGAIARAEATARDDPSKKIDLLKLLQVGKGGALKLNPKLQPL